MALGAVGRSCLTAVVGRQLLVANKSVPGLLSRALASSPNKLSPVDKPDASLAHSTAKDWKRVQDKQTGQHYWWNKTTDETTALGAPNPGAWQPVTDEKTGQQYWWHPDTGETTALGEPRPGAGGRQVAGVTPPASTAFGGAEGGSAGGA